MPTLRKHEREALEQALEAEYASPARASQALFNLVVELLTTRKSVVVGVAELDRPPIIYGPFYDLRTERKCVDRWTGFGFETRTATLYPMRAEKIDGTSRYCYTCTHPTFAHGWPMTGDKCIVRKCKCKCSTQLRDTP